MIGADGERHDERDRTAVVGDGGAKPCRRTTGRWCRPQEQVAARLGISVPYLGRAERVLREAPNLAVQVLYGAIELNAAVGKLTRYT